MRLTPLVYSSISFRDSWLVHAPIWCGVAPPSANLIAHAERKPWAVWRSAPFNPAFRHASENQLLAAFSDRAEPWTVVSDVMCRSPRALKDCTKWSRSSGFAKSGSALSNGIDTSPPVFCCVKDSQPSRGTIPGPRRTQSLIRAPV